MKNNNNLKTAVFNNQHNICNNLTTTFFKLKITLYFLTTPLLPSWVNHYFTYFMYGSQGHCLVGLLMSCHRLTLCVVCWCCWRRVVVDAAACSTATCYWHNVAPLILPSLHSTLLLSFLLFKFPRRAAVVCTVIWKSARGCGWSSCEFLRV